MIYKRKSHFDFPSKCQLRSETRCSPKLRAKNFFYLESSERWKKQLTGTDFQLNMTLYKVSVEI